MPICINALANQACFYVFLSKILKNSATLLLTALLVAVQSQPDNTTENYRYKEMLLLVYNRYLHYIWRYHIPETRLKIPHIRDS